MAALAAGSAIDFLFDFLFDVVFESNPRNAMGENWQEEARNGTMSLLSQITKAGPSLEEELVRLNQEAGSTSQPLGKYMDLA